MSEHEPGKAPERQPLAELDLPRQLERHLEIANQVGLQSRLVVIDASDPSSLKEVLVHQGQETMTAVSLNKLAIAQILRMAASERFEEMVDLESLGVGDALGGGRFDPQASRPAQATVAELDADMLTHSGNMAAIALVRQVLGGPTEVNQRLLELGLEQTQLEVLPDGQFYLGQTTAADISKLLLLADPRQDHSPTNIAHLLLNNPAEDGTRRFVRRSSSVAVARKKGAINDATEGKFRHEAGWVVNPEMAKAYVFAALFRAPLESDNSGLGHFVASGLLAQIGAELALASGERRLVYGRRLARAALKYSRFL